MTELALPSFDVHPWTPPLLAGGDCGLCISEVVLEAPDRAPIWTLAGSYRIPEDPHLRWDTPLPALVAVAVDGASFFPVARQLSREQLEGAPGTRTGTGYFEGAFALDLIDHFQLHGYEGWFTIVCSILDWTSEPLEFEALGGAS